MKKTFIIIMILSLLFSAFGCVSSKNDNAVDATISDKKDAIDSVAIDSVSVVDNKSQLYGFIDETGSYVIEPQYEELYEFAENGLAQALDPDSYLWGYIDETGDYVIEPQFLNAGIFAENGLAIVKNAN